MFVMVRLAELREDGEDAANLQHDFDNGISVAMLDRVNPPGQRDRA